jgi:ketosteroid isomerase-like protein
MMIPKIFSMKPLFVLILFSMSMNNVQAQSKENSIADKVLFTEIAHMDSVLFEAYNAQNIDKMKTLFTEDLEWYQDNGGLLSYETVLGNFRAIFDRFKTLNTPIRRDLVQGSLEVHPIKDYGAIHIGKHTFCHSENGKNDCGTFKFLMIWRKKEGTWKVSRVVSYDH